MSAPILKKSSKLSFSNSISINPTNPKKEKKIETETNISSRPKEAFTSEEFVKALKSFKTFLHDKGKDSLASIFEVVPEIKENTIHLLIENKALEDEFNAQKADFSDFIRKELSNYNISVETEVNKDVKLKKAYTPQEKFVKMSEKNPQLKQLIQKLDMDIGYA